MMFAENIGVYLVAGGVEFDNIFSGIVMLLVIAGSIVSGLVKKKEASDDTHLKKLARQRKQQLQSLAAEQHQKENQTTELGVNLIKPSPPVQNNSSQEILKQRAKVLQANKQAREQRIAKAHQRQSQQASEAARKASQVSGGDFRDPRELERLRDKAVKQRVKDDHAAEHRLSRENDLRKLRASQAVGQRQADAKRKADAVLLAQAIPVYDRPLVSLDLQSIRSAIVMQEILGKPLATRFEEQELAMMGFDSGHFDKSYM